jgi:hypothetical protein
MKELVLQPGVLLERTLMRTLRRHQFSSEEIGRIAEVAERIRATMADGLFYTDTREPFVSVAPAAVTLAATDKALYTASQFPVLGGQYWGRPGKKVRIRLFGQMTTGATPGNGTFDIYYGSGADANGTILASSGTLALVANATNLSWMLDIVITCRTTGSAGTLFCTGLATLNVGLLLSTAAPMLIPASAPVASAAVDLTAANILSVQFKRSGSTAETMQVLEMEVSALN